MDIKVGNIVRLKKKTSLREQRVGGIARRRRFQTEVYGMRTSDHDRAQAGRKKYKGNTRKYLKTGHIHAIIKTRDI